MGGRTNSSGNASGKNLASRPVSKGFYASQVVLDFFYQQHVSLICVNFNEMWHPQDIGVRLLECPGYPNDITESVQERNTHYKSHFSSNWMHPNLCKPQTVSSIITYYISCWRHFSAQKYPATKWPKQSKKPQERWYKINVTSDLSTVWPNHHPSHPIETVKFSGGAAGQFLGKAKFMDKSTHTKNASKIADVK